MPKISNNKRLINLVGLFMRLLNKYYRIIANTAAVNMNSMLTASYFFIAVKYHVNYRSTRQGYTVY